MHREKKSEHTCKAKYEEVGVSEKKWSKDQQGEVADCYGMDKAHKEYSEKGFRKRQNANTKGAANRAAQKGTCEIVTDLYNY